ncbi:unnamed protein product [Didymodactylos carnosus]|uniref:Uncharacterized protein n=1 Tax=Didymodactylos carnosus TaxID=1234261 RepID=A0A815CQJ0_9BILA|nr:unnamed protein product [Didymodactylos carnosus]CAF1407379.1 unnamed protein product [Didymodactylos carnosus]CAF4088721.1 unnamed protein product [Didymodactylos carnosus]CAF4212514.1 unnamed protein product [Didymodactylos carnosus]
MRNEERSTVGTLGAYCYLLDQKLPNTHGNKGFIVYRDCILTDEMTDDYRRALDKDISLSAYTSTSKSRQRAELFGNTLFIINIGEGISEFSQNDISKLSLGMHLLLLTETVRNSNSSQQKQAHVITVDTNDACHFNQK